MTLLYRGRPYTVLTQEVIMPEMKVRYRGRQLIHTHIKPISTPIQLQFFGRVTAFAMT